MSKSEQLNKMFIEKLECMNLDNNVKDFIISILNYEKSIANLEGNVKFKEEYRKRIDQFITKEDRES